MNAASILEEVIRCLARLPGVGRRSAERMALRLAREPEGLLSELVRALTETARHIRYCSACGSLTTTDADPCRLCTDPGRDATLLCVVEDPNDIRTIESTGSYRGRYHALMGRVSPMRGEGPADLRLDSLLARVREGGYREVILALNTDVESDATASMVASRLRGTGARISRIAFGLPVGSGVAYADPVTISRAMRGRQEV